MSHRECQHTKKHLLGHHPVLEAMNSNWQTCFAFSPNLGMGEMELRFKFTRSLGGERLRWFYLSQVTEDTASLADVCSNTPL